MKKTLGISAILLALYECGIHLLFHSAADPLSMPTATLTHSLENVPVEILLQRDSSITINGRAVDIRFSHSAKVAGTILSLPGWNFARQDVCSKSDFCDKALAAGFNVIFPEMKKSIYASKMYTETRSDWKGYPQLKFITDTLIPTLQKEFGLLKPGQRNFLYGISTGGRGVAMIALHTDSLFTAGAALSGDYDQTKMIKDNLMTGWYGPFSKFKDRWETDNPYQSAAKIRPALYLAHGGSDSIVPTQQTKLFYDQLVKVNKDRSYKLHIVEGAGHNYQFWGGETEAVLKFFNDSGKK